MTGTVRRVARRACKETERQRKEAVKKEMKGEEKEEVTLKASRNRFIIIPGRSSCMVTWSVYAAADFILTREPRTAT